MSKLEMIHVKNGEGNNPLFQIGVRHADGTHTAVRPDILKEHQAVALLAELQPTVVEEIVEEVVEEIVEEVVEEVVSDFDAMTKLELEALMREHGVELDRRIKKKDLLLTVKSYFNGSFNI